MTGKEEFLQNVRTALKLPLNVVTTITELQLLDTEGGVIYTHKFNPVWLSSGDKLELTVTINV